MCKHRISNSLYYIIHQTLKIHCEKEKTLRKMNEDIKYDIAMPAPKVHIFHLKILQSEF